MIHKIHVTTFFEQHIDTVFAAISDHQQFLSGGGLTCQLIREGSPQANGNGAIRQISNAKMQFHEEIYDFVEQQHFAYVITSTTPIIPLKHHKGWLDFSSIDQKTRVDWHSHIEFTTPLIGPIIGWIVKRKMSSLFQKRLSYQQKLFQDNI